MGQIIALPAEIERCLI